MKRFKLPFKNALILGFGLSIGVGLIVIVTISFLFASIQSAQGEINSFTVFRNLISQEQIHVLRYTAGATESLGDYSSVHQRFLEEAEKYHVLQRAPQFDLVVNEENNLAGVLLSSRDELGVLDTLAVAEKSFNQEFGRVQVATLPNGLAKVFYEQRAVVNTFNPRSNERDAVQDNFRTISGSLLDEFLTIGAGEETVNAQREISHSAEQIFAVRVQLTDDILPKYAALQAGVNEILTNLSAENGQRRNLTFILIAALIATSILIEVVIAILFIRYATHTNNRLEQQNRAIKTFTRVITHELRTPLTIILGFAEQARENTRGEKREALNVITATAQDLRLLINNLLDFSKIEAGKTGVTPEKFNVTDLLQTIKENFTYIARQKKLKIITKAGREVGEAHTDKLKFQQILTNLVNNAIKFTEKGSITIRSAVKGDELIVDVIDTGIGMKRGSLRKLFKEFEQVGDESQQQEGTGLGLNISYKLVQMLGGTITVKSTYGKGATFTVVLPLVVAPPSGGGS